MRVMAGQKDPDSVPNMDATLSQSQKIDIAALLNKVSENQRAAAAMNNEQKESERMVSFYVYVLSYYCTDKRPES